MGKHALMDAGMRWVGVIALVTLCLTGCGSDRASDSSVAGGPATGSSTTFTDTPAPDPDPAGAEGVPTTYDEAVAHVDSATDSRTLDAFQSPSGNLHCRFVQPDPDSVSCELLEGRIEPTGDACPTALGISSIGRIEMTGTSLHAICNTDTIVDPSDEVLAYGQAVEIGRFACIIERIGVTCVAIDSERGFFLARGTYELFG